MGPFDIGYDRSDLYGDDSPLRNLPIGWTATVGGDTMSAIAAATDGVQTSG